MLETVLAVLCITFAFFALFRLSHMLMGKILVEHAAMRVARARAVGAPSRALDTAFLRACESLELTL